ncbi:MAG: prepilin-type N-terminal cleavage/methylation domain-containing protein [Patescibacteria group bacterium]
MKYGFTLIELLVVSGITLLLVAAAFPIYSNLQVSSQLNEGAAQLIQNLRLMRTMSAARLHNIPHGIYFDSNPTGPDRYVVFQGTSYAAREQGYDRVVQLDSAISLAPSLTQGSQEIVFSNTFALPSATGTVILTHSVSGARTLSINGAGKAEYE